MKVHVYFTGRNAHSRLNGPRKSERAEKSKKERWKLEYRERGGDGRAKMGYKNERHNNRVSSERKGERLGM